MKRSSQALVFLLATTLVLQVSCGNQEKPEASQPTAAPAGAGAEKQLRATQARLEELSFEQESLKARVDRMEKLADRVDKVERQVEIARSAVNSLEKRPIPPTARVVEKVTEKEPPVEKKKVVLDAPVPSGAGGSKAAAEEGATDEKNDQAPYDEAEKADEVGAGSADDADDAADEGDVAVGKVELVNMKFATDVDRETRNPVDERDTFKKTENRLYCWLVLSNLAEEKTKVDLVWKHEGKALSTIELNVGKHTSHWRTWAYIRPHLVGQWEAVIVDLAGREVGAGKFTVTE
jgi:hypothetical protein